MLNALLTLTMYAYGQSHENVILDSEKNYSDSTGMSSPHTVTKHHLR